MSGTTPTAAGSRAAVVTAPSSPLPAGAAGAAAPGEQPAAIEVERLARRFGRREVLRDVTLTVPPGGFLLLLGANGAGKTTLLRILATLLPYRTGSVRVGGADVREEPQPVRRATGFMGHSPLLYGDLTARENLRFYAEMYRVGARERRIDEVLELVGMSARGGDAARTLSTGMRQRLSLARALLHRPSVLMLDEPYAGLDERGAVVLDAVLDAWVGRGTVVMVTHEPWRALDHATSVLELKDGIAAPAERYPSRPPGKAGK